MSSSHAEQHRNQQHDCSTSRTNQDVFNPLHTALQWLDLGFKLVDALMRRVYCSFIHNLIPFLMVLLANHHLANAANSNDSEDRAMLVYNLAGPES